MKPKKKAKRKLGNPTSLEMRLKGRIVNLEAVNKALDGEVSKVLEELWERVEVLENEVKELKGSKNESQ
jgi:hypothetical protein